MLYQLKAIRKKTKPPVWRRILVPARVTFSQTALVLETLLEIPYTTSYEFEFYTLGDRFTESEELHSGGSQWSYSRRIGSDNYIDSWFDRAKWFTFRILDCDLPEYRVEIEELVESAIIEEADDSGKEPVNFPTIIESKCYGGEIYWSLARESIRSLGRQLIISCGDKHGIGFETALADMNKGHGIECCNDPVNDDSRTIQSVRSAFEHMADTIEIVAGLQQDIERLEAFESDKNAYKDEEEFLKSLSERDERIDRINKMLQKIDPKAYEDAKRNSRIRTSKETVKYGVNPEKDEISHRFIKLDKFLAREPASDLKQMAKDNDIPVRGSNSKRLSFEIATYMLEPANMRRLLMDCTEEELDAFELAQEKECYRLREGEWAKLEQLYLIGYLLAYNDDFVEVPEDVKHVYGILKRSGYREARAGYDWLSRCSYYFNRYYIASEVKVFYRICSIRPELTGSFDEFMCAWKFVPDEYRYITIDGNYAAVSSLSSSEIGKVLKAQADLPYYIPTVDEINELYDNEYPVGNPEYEKFHRYMTEKLGASSDAADAVCRNIFEALVRNQDTQDILSPLWDESIDPEKVHFDKIKNMFTSIAESERSRLNRGHNAEECIKLINRRSNGMILDFPMNPVGKPANAKPKIYPNDPCPCGSGKKYKKCCGRAD